MRSGLRRSRMHEARRVGVTVPFFFAGADSKPYQSDGNEPSPAYIDDFVTTSDGLRLMKACMRCGPPCDGTSLRSWTRSRASNKGARAFDRRGRKAPGT